MEGAACTSTKPNELHQCHPGLGHKLGKTNMFVTLLACTEVFLITNPTPNPLSVFLHSICYLFLTLEEDTGGETGATLGKRIRELPGIYNKALKSH